MSPPLEERLKAFEPMGVSLVDPSAELHDPTPDLHDSFQHFDFQFFDGALQSCLVQWSKQMTTCAGTCTFKPRENSCVIRLSEPLLKLRPRKDFVETLLHEMIHAFLFLRGNRDGRDGHGPEFQFHMHRINKIAGTRISTYHSFHDEVKLYKTHWWRCNGPCQHQKPFYGYVKRSKNRAPAKTDFWFASHQANCGGTFIKVKEPEKKVKVKAEKKEKKVPSTGRVLKKKRFDSPNNQSILSFVKVNGETSKIPVSGNNGDPFNSDDDIVVISSDSKKITAGPSTFKGIQNVPSTRSKFVQTTEVIEIDDDFDPELIGLDTAPSTFVGTGYRLGGDSSEPNFLAFLFSVPPDSKPHFDSSKPSTSKALTPSYKPLPYTSKVSSILSSDLVCCPNCPKRLPLSEINIHLDACLS